MANQQRSWRTGLRQTVATIAKLSAELGFEIDPMARIDRISVAEQQRVEIIKVLASGARYLVLDEPTAVLTDAESERLLATTRDIAEKGASVVLITHKLREVLEFADWVTVMRAGKTVASTSSGDLSAADLARLMVGTAPPDESVAPGQAGAEVLSVSNLQACRDDGVQTVNDLSLAVQGGEIYGVAGVGGNGQTELAEILMGVRAPLGGEVKLDSEDITKRHPRTRRRRGIRSVPADRFRYGLSPDLSVGDNYSITKLTSGSYGSFLWVSQSALRKNTRAAIERFEIQGAGTATRAGLLSGGNAQKLVLARELSDDSRLIISHSPTRGLDVRACAAVHEHLVAARDAGAAVLLISEDLDEILMLSDRVGVLNRGRIVGEFSRPVNRVSVGECMAGHA
jgi:simple sugar transport system ATP-binding protein